MRTDTGAGRAGPGPCVWSALAVVLCSRAGVRNDLAEVVVAHCNRTTSAKDEVVLGQQRPVLCVTAEVGGRTWQVVAEPPHAAVVPLLVRNAVLERAEERVKGHGRTLVRNGQRGAPYTGEPALSGLDSRNVGLECHA